MFDIGAGEILGLGVVALMLLGPKRLPTFASDAAKFLHKVKGFTSNATAELRDNLGPGFENLDIADLNPKLSFGSKWIRFWMKTMKVISRSIMQN